MDEGVIEGIILGVKHHTEQSHRTDYCVLDNPSYNFKL